jgi:hypothetical protein
MAALVAAMACYGLGAFGRDEVVEVAALEFASGGFTYTGPLAESFFKGQGQITFRNGERYTGGFAGGHFHGQGVFDGIFRYADGPESYNWRFEGLFEDGQPVRGTIVYDENQAEPGMYQRGLLADSYARKGWRYEGGFDARGQAGVGRFFFGDGWVYEGSFTRGMAEGPGVYTDAAGQVVYRGEFKDGLFHGQGVYYSPEGWSYEGAFAQGLFEGEGVITQGQERIRGAWREGRQVRRDGE